MSSVMRKIGTLIKFAFLVLSASAFLNLSTNAQNTAASATWVKNTSGPKVDRSANMKIELADGRLQKFSFYTSFFIKATENFHECSIDVSNTDNVSKWTYANDVTKVTDEFENETTFTPTKNGFII